MDFGAFNADAVLFDTSVGRSVWEALPVTVSLTGFYGPIPGDHGEAHPVPTIPTGGIAYSRTGSHLCLFFGQDPAWPVDHIGRYGRRSMGGASQHVAEYGDRVETEDMTQKPTNAFF